MFYITQASDDEGDDEQQTSSSPAPTPASSQTQITDKSDVKPQRLSRTLQPIESYRHLKTFLLLWKRLEVFKYNWGRNKLKVEEINTPRLFNEYCIEYKRDMLYPVLQV